MAFIRRKNLPFIIVGLIFIAGLVMMYSGNDALSLASEKKDGILNAEQIKVSFDSVSGKLIKENVKEAQEVKKGDILMVLDSTDTDIAIAQLEAQIKNMEANINSASTGVNISLATADNDEQQSFRAIDQQKQAIASAQATLANKQLDYDRKASLVADGALAQQQLDDAQMALDVAKAAVAQQEQLLSKLLAGTSDNSNTDAIALPTIAVERQSAQNKLNDVESLRQQKKALEAQLQQLKVNKERLTLRAPEDGKILKVIAKEGEMVSPNTPVILMESKRCYYDIYVSEEKLGNLHEGDILTGTTVAGNHTVKGTIRLITRAPGFADLKMSREKGQSDLTAFQVRTYIEPTDGVIPGMTIGVKLK